MIARLRAWLEETRARTDAHRERGWDLARSWAIVMMVLINFQLMLAARPPAGGLTPGEQLLRWLVHVPSGRSSTLFVVLAGAGISLLSRRARRGGDRIELRVVRRTLLLRAVFLFVAGNLLHVVWPIDILHFYACYLVLAVLLLRAPDLVLVVVAALVTIGAVVVSVSWPGRAEHPYLSPLGLLFDALIDGVHPIFPWFAFLAWGLVLGRRDLGDAVVRRRWLRRASLLVVLTELTSLLLTHFVLRAGAWWGPPWRHAWSAWWAPHMGLLETGWDPAPLFVVSACGTATVFVCLAHELVSRRDALIVRALVATGQLALSIYVLHALLGVVWPRMQFGLGRTLSVAAVTAYWLAFVGVVVVGAALYRRVLPRGPLEQLMRVLSSWRLPSERRAVEATAPAATAPPATAPAATAPAATAPAPPHDLRAQLSWSVVGVGALALVLARGIGWGLGAEPRLALTQASELPGELTLLHPRREYTFEVTEPREGVFETRSGLDLYLELDRVEGGTRTRLAEDDDGGGHLDARLRTHLTPGHYVLVVRPYGAAMGPYVLAVTPLG